MRLGNFICLYLLSVICFYETQGQIRYNNALQFETNGFYIQGRFKSASPFKQLGISYKRTFFQHWQAGIRYMQWISFGRESLNRHLSISEPNYERGKIMRRKAYKMVDVYVSYKYNLTHKHSISGSLGVSRCWGENMYLTDYTVNPDPAYDAILYKERREEAYWGYFPQISYDYHFLNNRLNLGLDIRVRHYVGMPALQNDFGFHAGFNF